MLYSTCRDTALKIMNQYSIAGTPIAASYNNQADYLARIPEIINAALTYIATHVHPIIDTFTPSLTTIGGSWSYFDMPDDTVKLDSITKYDSNADDVVSIWGYRYMTNKRISIKTEDITDATVSYQRYPTLLTGTPSDSTVLDVDEGNAQAIPYYVAAGIVEQDDPQQYAYWFNQWERMLTGMPLTTEVTINDDYGVSSVYEVY